MQVICACRMCKKHFRLIFNSCSRSVVPPIYMSTTYKKEEVVATPEFSYYENPTRTVLEETLAAIDNGRYCLSFPSGTGGQMALITTMTAGDRIICGDNIYTGTIGLFRDIAANFGIETEFVDLTKLENLKKSLTPSTKMVWMETPTNPMMIVLDIRGIAGRFASCYTEWPVPTICPTNSDF